MLTVLQEITLASNSTVVAGCRRAISFDTLDKAAYNLHDMLTRDPSFVARILDLGACIGELETSALAYGRQIFYFRYLVSRGLGGRNMLGLFYQIQTSSHGFLTLLC